MAYNYAMDQDLLRLYENITNANNLRTAYITPKAEETNHLEFKQKSDARNDAIAKNDRYNFSKTLSSFSNADGGILIWGVSTRRKNGADYASALKPIINVNVFAESLRDSLIDSVVPRNHKVQIKSIANRQGNGFVVCMIPASDDVPVRAMNAYREYWARADGRSMKLEHYQIKDMMLRHSLPDLELEITASEVNLPQDQIKIMFKLINKGKSLAKFWGYFIQTQNIELTAVEQCSDVSNLNPGTTAISNDGGSNSVIYPNKIRVGVGSVTVRKAINTQNLAIHARWYCEDMSLKEHVFSLRVPAVP
jgi:hypothetical protein